MMSYQKMSHFYLTDGHKVAIDAISGELIR